MAAAFNRLSSRINMIMSLQRTTSRPALMASREGSIESIGSGRIEFIGFYNIVLLNLNALNGFHLILQLNYYKYIFFIYLSN